jgi:hypothetical protein
MLDDLKTLYRLCDALADACLAYKMSKDNKTAHGVMATKTKLAHAQDLADQLSKIWTEKMPAHWDIKKGRLFVMQSKDELKFALAPTGKGLSVPTRAADIFYATNVGLRVLDMAPEMITTEEKKKRRLLPESPLSILINDHRTNSHGRPMDNIHKVKAQNGPDALAQLLFQGATWSRLYVSYTAPCTEAHRDDLLLHAKRKADDYFMNPDYHTSYSAAFWETACQDTRMKALLKSNQLKQKIDWEKGYRRRDFFKDEAIQIIYKDMKRLDAPETMKQFLVSFNKHTGEIVRAWSKESAFLVKAILTVFPRGTMGDGQTPYAWELTTA